MIELVKFRPVARAPKLICTGPARIRCLRDGRVEFIMVRSQIPGGLPIEVGSCVWPSLEALLNSRFEVSIALERMLRDMRN